MSDPIDRHLSKEEVAMFCSGAAASMSGVLFAAGGIL
jgi:ATP-dependent protease ClpP protease subunit